MLARQRGFTLIELLVVLSILGLLIGLTIPAAQSARESSRRLECVNHLKQLGIALAQHESHYSYYPSAREGRWRRTPTSRPGIAFPAPRQGFYDLLPFLEQQVLYNSFNTAIDLASLIPIELNSNMTAGRTAIAGFLCPSDLRPVPAVPGPCSYRYNVGMLGSPVDSGSQDCLDQSGAFVLSPPSRPRDFTDGLSHTVGLSERLLGSRAAQSDRPDRTRDLWFVGIAGMVTPSSADEVMGYCGSLQAYPLEYQSDLGRSWDEGSFTSGWYNHVATPNAATMDCTLGRKQGADISDMDIHDTALAARSAHPGGVNSLMMDGSVHSIRDGISPRVWRSLGTRSGGEVMDTPY